MLPGFACWCEQDQVATVLEACIMQARSIDSEHPRVIGRTDQKGLERVKGKTQTQSIDTVASAEV